jgi:hypothetical protein
MFGIFKKTSWKIDGKAFDFFDKLFKKLPPEISVSVRRTSQRTIQEVFHKPCNERTPLYD